MAQEIQRILDLNKVIANKSCFLLGPRQTGKSFLIRSTLSKYKVYNLLDNETYVNLSFSPKRLREELSNKDKVIIIDEIQKLPSLLDEIHLLIEEKKIKFLLTGSSARKLRRGGVNLLGGRANIKNFHPFSIIELKDKFNLLKAINHGLIPSIYLSNNAESDLESYIGTYLKEEIANEALTRNISAFSRFLEVAALCNGKIINYSKISNDAQVPRTTVQEYFQILIDTLIGYELPSYKKTKKRKPISTSKFYFFDVGVCNILQKRTKIKLGSPESGEAFETYIFHEIRTFLDYKSKGELCYWRSQSGFEVDFIINDKTAIEVKASKNITGYDLKGLFALKEESHLQNYIVASLEEKERKVNGIKILPFKLFLEMLWEGEFT